MKLTNLLDRLESAQPISVYGQVTKAVGLTVEGTGPLASVGQGCRILQESGAPLVDAEVIGFRGDRVLLMPLGDVRGIGAGNRIQFHAQPPRLRVSPQYLGRVVDGLGRPIDQRGPIPSDKTYPIDGVVINPMERQRISQPMDLGIRAINGFLTCGIGQKLGIFAGSGVGKSVLMGMICRHTTADVNVIALIGERGREVKEFIEKDLGQEGLQRSVIVVATSDQPPLVRLRAALVATSIAGIFP